MNPLLMLRIGALALAGAVVGTGVVTVWQLKTERDQLRADLTTAEAQRAAASETASHQAQQIDWLQRFAVQQQAATRALFQRLDTLNRMATARAAKLETVLDEDQDAARWGATRLPAAVVRVLDLTEDSATAPADHPALPAGDRLPVTGDLPADQPPTGGGTAADAGGT